MSGNSSKTGIALSAMLLILFLAGPAMAVEIRQGDFLVVPEGNIKGPLFAVGNNLTINADVEGDVFCAGQNININGTVNGDLLAAGQLINVNGIISGDVRAAGNQIDIKQEVNGSVTGAGNTIALSQGSRVRRDVLLFGNAIQESGVIDGQFMGSAQQILINGTINDGVKIWDVQKLNVGPTAVVHGSLAYGSSSQAEISPQARVGSIIRDEKPAAPAKAQPPKGFSWWAALGWLAAALLIWGAVYMLFPGLLPAMARVLKETPAQSLGWGFLMLLVIPVAAVVFIITIIGIPLALVLIFTYVFILGAAKIIVGDALARYLSERFGWSTHVPVFVSFIITFLLLIALSEIPVLGFFIELIVVSLALGVAVLAFYRWRNQISGKQHHQN